MEKNENFVDIHVSFNLNDLDKLASSLAAAMTIMKDCDNKLATKDMVHQWFKTAFDKPVDIKTVEAKTVDTSDNSSSNESNWD